MHIYYDYFIDTNENRDNFVIRLKENRNLLFKGKAKKVGEIVKRRKDKIRMNMYHIQERNYHLVIVYRLSEEKPVMMLTNNEKRCSQNNKSIYE